MKLKSKILLYICIVILPVLLFGSIYFKYYLKDDETKRQKDAKWIGSIYQSNWGQFITETVTSLKTLSFSTEENLDELEIMKPLLQQVNESDPRYGGIYLLDKHGNILLSSDVEKPKIDFSSLAYIQEAKRARDTVISSKIELSNYKQQILGLATPVMDNKERVVAILVTYLRLDYMKNLMSILTPNAKVYVVNGSGNDILDLNVTSKDINEEKAWVSVPMDRLPWTIKIKMAPVDYKEIGKSFGKALIVILVFAHILYLLVAYILLRRQAIKEKNESEMQKLELVGTLAASTAHEIRNPLTGVKGLIQLLSEKYTAPEDRFYFDVIDSELKRINEIVSEFLILGKPTAQYLVNINIAEALEELKPLIISEGNSYNVECIWEISAEPILVRVVKDQFKQVILNLTKNAFESIEASGIVQIHLYPIKDTCKLEIMDNGKGISKEDLEKIFQPFYTSKETGTGLGLVICKRIIQSFGGTIQVKSAQSSGTTVEITLPLTKNKQA